MYNKKQIVIAPGKGMGNFISMLGCFQTISKKINKKITILTKKNTSAKMYLNDQIFCEEIIYIDESKRGLLNIYYNFHIFLKLVKLLKSLNTEQLYVLHPSKKYVLAGVLARIKKIYAPGYRYQSFFLKKESKYYSNFFCKALDPLIESQELIKKIFKIKSLESGLLKFKKLVSKNYVAICIATSGFEKQWGIENYLKVFEYLIHKGKNNFIILSGKDQYKIENDLFLSVTKKYGNINILKTSEKKMDYIYKILKEADYYIGNDTGISHLAVAMGLHSIIIHGDCPPHNYSNLIHAIDNDKKIRSKTSIKKILFQKVKNKIDEILK